MITYVTYVFYKSVGVFFIEITWSVNANSFKIIFLGFLLLYFLIILFFFNAGYLSTLLALDLTSLLCVFAKCAELSDVNRKETCTLLNCLETSFMYLVCVL